MTISCELPGGGLNTSPDNVPEASSKLDLSQDTGRLIAGGGCFWCTEAVFLEVEGVTAVTSGYAGDSHALANYEAVCSGATNHAEVIEVRYDPARTSYTQLLRLFFAVAHDPTQRDRQGNDRGRQYRSVVFYENDAQRETVARYIAELDESGLYSGPIVTTLEPFQAFYPAEDYHQNYAQRNAGQPYIRFAAAPKLEKLKRYFTDLLKT